MPRPRKEPLAESPRFTLRYLHSFPATDISVRSKVVTVNHVIVFAVDKRLGMVDVNQDGGKECNGVGVGSSFVIFIIHTALFRGSSLIRLFVTLW
jgi:hypothetical protein